MRFKNLERFRTGGTATKPMLNIPLPRTTGGLVSAVAHSLVGGATPVWVTP
ncbi:MAG TPA: hypothetical protein VFE10_00660 [Phenylobacterium sp.]|jgi:hypothetical protein|nr:hypothetical protein [Phenylobacterium sp.]